MVDTFFKNEVSLNKATALKQTSVRFSSASLNSAPQNSKLCLLPTLPTTTTTTTTTKRKYLRETGSRSLSLLDFERKQRCRRCRCRCLRSCGPNTYCIQTVGVSARGENNSGPYFSFAAIKGIIFNRDHHGLFKKTP